MAPAVAALLVAHLAAAPVAGGGVRRDSGWSFDPADLKAPGGRYPQLVDANPLYRAAIARPAPAGVSGLLLCHVSVSDPHRWDVFRGPDLRVSLRVGTEPARVGWGPEDRGAATVSFPNVTLPRAGARLEIAVFDRDAGTDEHIGTVEHAFAGARAAFSIDNPTFRMRCAALENARFRARAERARDRAHDAAKQLQHAPAPDLTLPEAGRPSSAVTDLVRATEEVVAYVGWADADVQLLLAAARDAERGWPASVARTVREAEAKATPAGRFVAVDGARVALREVKCGKRALRPWRAPRSGGEGRGRSDLRYLADSARCVFLLDVEAGAQGLALSGGHARHELGELRVYTARGDSISLLPLDYLRGGASVTSRTVELDAGERVTLVALPASLIRPGSRAPRVLAILGEPGAVFRIPW